jgi:hypothetical protein
MKKGTHPNSLANLKKGRTIQEQKNKNHGRRKSVFTLAKEMEFSADDVSKLYKRLYWLTEIELHGIVRDAESTSIEKTIASAILKDIENGTLRSFDTFMDRSYGKPRQTTELEGSVNLAPPPIIIEGENEDD